MSRNGCFLFVPFRQRSRPSLELGAPAIEPLRKSRRLGVRRCEPLGVRRALGARFSGARLNGFRTPLLFGDGSSLGGSKPLRVRFALGVGIRRQALCESVALGFELGPGRLELRCVLCALGVSLGTHGDELRFYFCALRLGILLQNRIRGTLGFELLRTGFPLGLRLGGHTLLQLCRRRMLPLSLSLHARNLSSELGKLTSVLLLQLIGSRVRRVELLGRDAQWVVLRRLGHGQARFPVGPGLSLGEDAVMQAEKPVTRTAVRFVNARTILDPNAS